MSLPATSEINDDDLLIRRVKKLQIDEKGFPVREAFSLRSLPSGTVEVSLSVQLNKLLANTSNALNGVKNANDFELFKLKAEDAKKIKFGVCHSPSNNDKSHTSICGFFTDAKIDILRKATVKI